MKLEDAPRAGWYPDPEPSGLLRWWEGTDWTDEHRAVPTPTELANAVRPTNQQVETKPAGSISATRAGMSQRDTERIVSQVRDVAREEVDRAANLLSQRATTAIRRGRSAMAGYFDPIIRWMKIAIVTAAIAVIAWFVIQFIVQASLLSWLGDRIDNING